MQQSEVYKLHGYLEFFPIEVGFVTPVFSRNNQLFLGICSNNKFEKFNTFPNDYLQVLKFDFSNISYEVEIGDKCCYTFKLYNETIYGTSDDLIKIFDKITETKWLPYYAGITVKKFIETKRSISNRKISIMIVDDHTLIRDAWENLLDTYSNYEVVANTGDGQKAIDLAREKSPDIVLLDINMTPLNGFDVAKMMKKYSPKSRVIAVSMHSQPAYAKKMIRLGGKGYVTKNSPSIEMIRAIDEVYNGNLYICDEMLNNFAALENDEYKDEDKHGLSILTEREIEIINLIRNGSSSKEIADSLNISLKTVEVQRHNILKKLKIKNTASLINYINASGL